MTSPIRAKRIIHTIHAIRDIDNCRRQYQDVFGGIVFNEGYEPSADRDHALLYVADHMIEPMAPHDPANEKSVMNRFIGRFGEGWHSFEILVDNAAEAAAKLKAAGCELIETPYPVFFFVRPQSTGGILFEVCEKPMKNDPFDLPNWNPRWADGMACGLIALDHIACVVRELETPLHFFTELLDGTVIADERVDMPQPGRRVLVQLGGTRVAFTAPDDVQSGPLGVFLSRPNAGIYALVWQVEDIAQAKEDFAAKDLALLETACAGGGFAIDPADFAGARHEFVQPALR
jgi:catechol 2,3-dioxygenase-like lactoylglutathione lyase family enzyme